MDYNLNEAISKFTDFLKSETKTETVIGQQFELGEFKCVPVIAVGMGLGVGGGEGTDPKHAEGSGIGGGAGIGMGPIGFLVTKGEEIQFLSTRQSKGLGASLDKLPDLMVKYFEMKKGENEEAKASA